MAAAAVVATAAQSAAPPSADRQPPPGAVSIATRHLVLTPSASAVRGGRAVLNLDVALNPKMHVYAPDQPKDQDYMPIALTIASGEALRAEKPRYPPAEQVFFEPLKEMQHVYSKPFRITVAVALSKAAAATVTVAGSVRYQACDDAICYVPQTVAVKWTVPVSRDSR